MSILRKAGVVLMGVAVFAGAAAMSALLAKATWPDYAAADPTRDYSLLMLLARLAAGMLATVAAGWVTVLVDRQSEQTLYSTAVLLLLISLVEHYRVWAQYPVWYHLVWLISIVPCALLGGRLQTRQNPK
jgi:hypothetical protein